MRTRWLVGLTGAALGLLGLDASAHHGWGGQQQEQSEITGTVKTDVDLSGPHGSMQIVDDKGQVWDVTLAPAARTQNAGLKPGVIPIGIAWDPGMSNSSKVPASTFNAPIFDAPLSQNHKRRSGPEMQM